MEGVLLAQPRSEKNVLSGNLFKEGDCWVLIDEFGNFHQFSLGKVFGTRGRFNPNKRFIDGEDVEFVLTESGSVFNIVILREEAASINSRVGLI